MGDPLLLLRMEGPLQAWGTRGRWDIRDSALEPTKSGVIGLLGAALGYGRDDSRLAALDEQLRMGVRVEREAALLDDYHTITEFLPMADGGYKASGQSARSLERLLEDREAAPYTVQSRRRYLMDGAFLVALARRHGASTQLLEQCSRALTRPKWPLFLGRRSCVPTRPVLEGVTDAYASLEEALARHPWSCLGFQGLDRSAPRDDSPLRVVVEADVVNGGPSASQAFRDDRRRAGRARLYGRRFVTEYHVPSPGPLVQEIG